MSTALSNDEQKLLTFIQNNRIPIYRQAYSDRTAWQMACLAELAYEPWEEMNAEDALRFLEERCEELKELLEKKKEQALDVSISATQERDIKQEETKSKINSPGFTIEKIYNNEDTGTQAFIISTNEYLVLVFRGTESDSFRDLKTNFEAKKIPCSTGGRVHEGFKRAFESVSAAIQKDLNNNYPTDVLFITGHSLGGALATIASKRLTHKGDIAACYTFGSPRVADEDWSRGIEIPIYRVVNAIDCITMLPPSNKGMADLKLLFGTFPVVGKLINGWLNKYRGYFHVGDEKYLTPCKKGKYENVKLTDKVPFLKGLRIFVRGKGCGRIIRDHLISVYRKKLAVIASNPKT